MGESTRRERSAAPRLLDLHGDHRQLPGAPPVAIAGIGAYAPLHAAATGLTAAVSALETWSQVRPAPTP